MGQEQSAVNNIKTTKTKKAKLDDIIVVSKVNTTDLKLQDEDINSLRKIKLGKPIIHSSLDELEYVNIPRVIVGPFSEMTLRYQFHMTECADAVSYDQNALSKEIKEVDAFALHVFKAISERQKCIDNIIIQIKKATEIRHLMNKIETGLQSAELQFQELNNMLPRDERIKDIL